MLRFDNVVLNEYYFYYRVLLLESTHSLTQYMEWIVRGSLFDGDFCPGMKSWLSFTVTSQLGDAPVCCVRLHSVQVLLIFTRLHVIMNSVEAVVHVISI